MYNYKQRCHESLLNLLAYFNGNKMQMASTIGVSRNVVTTWFSNGKIGRVGALLVDANESIPFSKEDLRPDIKNWSAYKKPSAN